MPTKTYSVLKSTIKSINSLAKKTHRTQGAIVDIAVAKLAADDSVDLPGVVLPARKPRKIAHRKDLNTITDLTRNANDLVN